MGRGSWDRSAGVVTKLRNVGAAEDFVELFPYGERKLG
jgi:hypothetical protein